MDLIGGPSALVAVTSEPETENLDADPKKAIARLVEAAESRLAAICIVCGAAPAALEATGGYALNLCAHHSQQRQLNRRSMDTPWFDK